MNHKTRELSIQMDPIIEWLLQGDVAIQYQVWRDLLDVDKLELRERITTQGWGVQFLSRRHKDGYWGRGFYQPKWISSHYTLLDLKHLGISPDIQEISESIYRILHNHKASDGGINPAKTIEQSDVCINGMFLNYACYFRIQPRPLESIVDFLIREHMSDGGFNCQSNMGGAVHSSLHTTISVLEGIHEYGENGYTYKLAELEGLSAQAREFILQHRLYRSDRTGEVINRRFLMLSYPSRWFYDILRALVYFHSANVNYDPRMDDAMQVLLSKRRKDGKWPVQSRHAGQTHFEMEKTGGPSRWNTLRALRVLRWYGLDR
jgi:hypothetical protein